MHKASTSGNQQPEEARGRAQERQAAPPQQQLLRSKSHSRWSPDELRALRTAYHKELERGQGRVTSKALFETFSKLVQTQRSEAGVWKQWWTLSKQP